MKDYFERPAAIKQAQESQKGLFWVWELLIFIAIFFAASFVQGILITPYQIIMLAQHPEVTQAAASGNMELYMALLSELLSGNAYIIASLFANAGLIAVTLLFCKLIQKRKMTSLGFVKKDMIKEYLIGMGAGFLFFTAALLISILTGAMKFNGLSDNFSIGIFLLFTLGFLIQGMAEEVLCRGYFMVSLARRYPVAIAVLVNALFFACLHLLNSGISVLAFINLTLFGIFASVYFLKRGSIWGVAAFHSIWNLVQGNVYGVLVSGMGMDCSLFSTTMVEGKEWMNGGAFGAEGGLAVTIVYIAGIIFLYTRKTVDKGAE